MFAWIWHFGREICDAEWWNVCSEFWKVLTSSFKKCSYVLANHSFYGKDEIWSFILLQLGAWLDKECWEKAKKKIIFLMMQCKET